MLISDFSGTKNALLVDKFKFLTTLPASEVMRGFPEKIIWDSDFSKKLSMCIKGLIIYIKNTSQFLAFPCRDQYL